MPLMNLIMATAFHHADADVEFVERESGFPPTGFVDGRFPLLSAILAVGPRFLLPRAGPHFSPSAKLRPCLIAALELSLKQRRWPGAEQTVGAADVACPSGTDAHCARGELAQDGERAIAGLRANIG
jgi:hypothetical protein